MLKINPGQPTIWLRPDTLQIGLDAEAVIVGGLSPAHQRFIRTLQLGIADSQVGTMARSSKLGSTDVRELIDRLSPALLESPLLESSGRGQSDSDAERSDVSRPTSVLAMLRGAAPDFAEILRYALATNRDGSLALSQRASRVIHLEALDRTGVCLLRALATAGFAQFWSGDSTKVAPHDVNGIGYEKSELGKTRFLAATRIADTFTERTAMVDVTELRSRVLDRVDCAVLIGSVAIEPKRYERWMRLGVPHIAITFDSRGVQVSPLITPNKTPCLSCHESRLVELAEVRTLQVMQSVKAIQKYDDASAVMFATAMVVASVAEAMDSLGGFEHRGYERVGWFFERATGRVVQLEWPSEPRCGCY